MNGRKMLTLVVLGGLLIMLPWHQPAFAETGKQVPTAKEQAVLNLPHAEEAKAVQFIATNIIDGVKEKMVQSSITATDPDYSAVLVRNKGHLDLENISIDKSGDNTSGEYSDYAGLNAALLTTDAEASLDKCMVTTSGVGASGIFATGVLSHIRVHATGITTAKEASKGLAATAGATISANKLQITTMGKDSPAVFAYGDDATVLLSDAQIQTQGENSPIVNSVGTVSLVNTKGTALHSEMAILEGTNNLTLETTQLTGGKKWGVLLYASLFGTDDAGTAVFSARNSTLNSVVDGPLFYVTNTRAALTLENATLNYQGDVLVNVAAGPWGAPGNNGAIFDLTVTRQKLNGNIVVDKLSEASVNLNQGAIWNGTVNSENTAKDANVNMNALAAWSLSGDAYLDVFTDDDLTLANVESNGYNIYYQPKNKANKWLHGKAYRLSGGGRIGPLKVIPANSKH